MRECPPLTKEGGAAGKGLSTLSVFPPLYFLMFRVYTLPVYESILKLYQVSFEEGKYTSLSEVF